MAKLDIKIYPDRILSKKSAPVSKVTSEEKTLVRNMIETMRFAKGVGLAAPQVGISKRIVVIDALEDNSEPLTLINPKVLQKKGKLSFCEGCLSVPDITEDIIRPEWIQLEALDLKGELIKIHTGGLLARVIQHEIDHLDGILFIDKLGFLKRRALIKKFHSKVCMEL